MTMNEMMVKVEDAIEALKEVLEELGTIHEDHEGPSEPDAKEWKWEGKIGVQPEVLGMFPAGNYEFDLNVDVPDQLLGKQKDFRVLLIDELDKGRGKDREAQFHVENGIGESKLFLGGHLHLGGLGWPGLKLDSERNLGQEDSWDLVSHVTGANPTVVAQSEFALVLGELVTHDRGRVTSPAGTRYEITMSKVG